jgi:hypothetical protein
MFPASEENALEMNLDDHRHSELSEDWERDRAEVDDVASYHKRRSAGVWAGLATLTVVLGVVVVYGYTVLKQEDIQVEQIPGLTKSIPAIGQHLASVERRLADARVDERKLASQVQTIDATTKAALDQTRLQTGQLAAHVQATLLKNLNQQTAGFQAQVSRLVSERNADLLRLGQVEEELAQARSELETTRADYTRQVASLREELGEEHGELVSLSNSLPTRQVPFKIQKNQVAAIIPGVSFQLTKIDVRRQRFSGWIESAPGSQKICIQSQGVRSPVEFYPGEHGKPFAMVVTSVDQKGAVGYFLTPTTNGTAGQTDIISSTGSQSNPKETSSGSGSSVAAP